LVCLNCLSEAQSPAQLNYQAALRGEDGCPLVDANVMAEVRITTVSLNGTLVYEEEHMTTSDAFGLIQLQIGAGMVTAASPNGSLSELDWGNQSHFLSLSIDEGAGPEPVGGMQLLSVPYALHAATASVAETVSNTDDADADPSNELVETLVLNNGELELQQASGSINVDLTPLQDDADADPNNELVESMVLNNGALVLQQADGVISVDLSPLQDDADPDPSNELLTDIVLSGTSLEVTEGGATHSVDLSSLALDQDWETTADVVYNEDESIGIGLSNPTSTLHIAGSISHEFRTIDGGITETLGGDDYILLCDNSNDNVVLNLPMAALVQGRVYRIKTIGSGGALNGTTTLQGGAFNTIEGSQSYVLDSFVSQNVEILSNGIQWLIIDFD